MLAIRSIFIRPAVFAAATFLTGCVGYAQPVGPGYGPVYGAGYVAPVIVAPPPVYVPVAPRPFWYMPPPKFHHHHHREWGRERGHRYRG